MAARRRPMGAARAGTRGARSTLGVVVLSLSVRLPPPPPNASSAPEPCGDGGRLGAEGGTEPAAAAEAPRVESGDGAALRGQRWELHSAPPSVTPRWSVIVMITHRTTGGPGWTGQWRLKMGGAGRVLRGQPPTHKTTEKHRGPRLCSWRGMGPEGSKGPFQPNPCSDPTTCSGEQIPSPGGLQTPQRDTEALWDTPPPAPGQPMADTQQPPPPPSPQSRRAGSRLQEHTLYSGPQVSTEQPLAATRHR